MSNTKIASEENIKKSKSKSLKEFFLKTLLPVHIVASMDFLITFYGQGDGFWENGLKLMSESNPFVDIIVEAFGYLGVLIAYITWTSGYTFIVYYASNLSKSNRQLVALFGVVSFYFGHMLGFLTWITYLYRDAFHDYLYWTIIISSMLILNALSIFIYSRFGILKKDKSGNLEINLI